MGTKSCEGDVWFSDDTNQQCESLHPKSINNTNLWDSVNLDHPTVIHKSILGQCRRGGTGSWARESSRIRVGRSGPLDTWLEVVGLTKVIVARQSIAFGTASSH